MTQIKLLIVDDLAANLVALESLLKSDEVEVFKAPSGEAALELVLKHEFALALIDIQMPEMDGFELAELMRGAERSKNVPIIFVTAGARNTRFTFKGYETGAVDFLYKPLDPYIVRSKAKVFIELQRQKILLNEQLSRTEKSEERLKEALHSRDEFLSLASHELKTPLTSLMLHLSFMARQISVEKNVAPPPEKLKKMATSSLKQVERLNLLIEDLLDVSRIQSGQLAFNIETFNLSDLVIEMAERFGEDLRLAKCELTLNIQENILGTWDPSRIEQIVVNLISNALKYAPGKPIKIDLHTEAQNAVFTITDQGPGIPFEAQSRIFDRFARATSPRNINGLGLGLFIVKRVVDGHHGNIKVQSEVGHGTSFKIELPLV